MPTDLASLPVAIVGAGPVGLAAAAHLLERGLCPVVLEAGASAGRAVSAWGHVRMFSPWRYDIDKACRRLLEAEGWVEPDAEHHPTGAEFVARYLAPLASTAALAPRIRYGQHVVAIARAGLGKVQDRGRGDAPLEVRTRDAAGREATLYARAVIDASGTWDRPNPAGASGLPAPGETGAAAAIRYGMPDVLGRDRGRHAGRTTMVVGSGHSATGTLIDLVRLAGEAQGTRIVWASRRKDVSTAFGGGDADQLPERGALGTRLAELVASGRINVRAPFSVERIETAADGRLRVAGATGCCNVVEEVDQLVVATGFRPDLAVLAELRLSLDPALECPAALGPLVDPNLHSCGTVRPHGAEELAHPEPGFWIAGMKSYGRAPTFLMATGYEQVRSIAAEIAGDREGARRVELDLPETGVCSAALVGAPEVASGGCCG